MTKTLQPLGCAFDLESLPLKSSYSCSEMQSDVQVNAREKLRLAKKKNMSQ